MHEVNGNKGLGLGTELSQLLALFYTTPLDYFIKSTLRIKYYIRYVDDGLFFSSSYEEAYEQLNQIRKFLKDYDLYLNRDKCRIIPLTESFTFLKLQIYKSNTGKIHIQLGDKGTNNCRNNLLQLKDKYDRNLISVYDVYESYNGWREYVKSFNAYSSLKKMDRYFNQLFFESEENT